MTCNSTRTRTFFSTYSKATCFFQIFHNEFMHTYSQFKSFGIVY